MVTELYSISKSSIKGIEVAPCEVTPIAKTVERELSPAEIWPLLERSNHPFFLDSSLRMGGLGRYSFIGVDPPVLIKGKGDRITIVSESDDRVVRGNPFSVLAAFVRPFRIRAIPSIPCFQGGAVGYFGYQLCHFIETLPQRGIDDMMFPDCLFGIYDCVITIDHGAGRSYIVSTGFPLSEDEARRKRAEKRLNHLAEIISSTHVEEGFSRLETERSEKPSLASNFTKADYIEAVTIAKKYIAEGDIFQVNLSQRFRSTLKGSATQLYRNLRAVSPSPFGAFLNIGDVTVASSSPERFLKVYGRLVETRPIKGTRPRGASSSEDEKLAVELQNSEKDRAENLMIADLLRNDLGKVCRYGSVAVPELFAVEAHPTVYHLVSTVTGSLRPGKDAIDVVQACFPGGSVTGAPKVRAMEIIDELEPTARSIYTGGLGYLSLTGDMDLSMVIRTFEIKGSEVFFQVGGGIVADSDPMKEYDETLHKAKGLIRALQARQ